MDYKIEVVTVPVSDVDRAAAFYTQKAGFTLDVDYHPASDFRVVQLTPPGSACSVQIGIGLTDAPPGSARATYLAVTDIEATRRELTRPRRHRQRHPAQGTDRGLEGRLAARYRPAAPRLRELRRLRRPGRQHLGHPGDRLPPKYPSGLIRTAEEADDVPVMAYLSIGTVRADAVWRRGCSATMSPARGRSGRPWPQPSGSLAARAVPDWWHRRLAILTGPSRLLPRQPNAAPLKPGRPG